MYYIFLHFTKRFCKKFKGQILSVGLKFQRIEKSPLTGGVSNHEFHGKNSKLEFCTISHMEFKMEFKWEVQIGFYGFSLYLIRIKNNKTSLFYFHKCKASANIFCFTQLLLIFALQVAKVCFKLLPLIKQRMYGYLWNYILTLFPYTWESGIGWLFFSDPKEMQRKSMKSKVFH